MEVRNDYLFAGYETKMNFANSQKNCQNIGATLPMLKTAAVVDAINYYNSKLMSYIYGQKKIFLLTRLLCI